MTIDKMTPRPTSKKKKPAHRSQLTRSRRQLEQALSAMSIAYDELHTHERALLYAVASILHHQGGEIRIPLASVVYHTIPGLDVIARRTPSEFVLTLDDPDGMLKTNDGPPSRDAEGPSTEQPGSERSRSERSGPATGS